MADEFWKDDLPAQPAAAPPAAAPPAAAPPADEFWKEDQPAAQSTLPADVQPSLAGAGRGFVQPPAVQPIPSLDAAPDQSPPLGDPMGSGAADIANAPANAPQAGAGRGMVNPPLVGDDTRQNVGALESFGRGYGKAGASSLQAFNLAVAAPVVLGEKLKNAISGSSDTSAQDAVFRNLVDPTTQAVNWYSLGPDEKQGFLAKVAESLGGLAQDLPVMIASGGEAAQAKLAQAFPTMTQFMGNAIGQGFTAMRPLMVKAGVEKAKQVLDAGGSVDQALTSASTAAMLTGFTGSQPMSSTGSVLERVLTGIPVGAVQSEAHRVVQNAADPQELQQPFSPEDAAAGALTNSIMAGSMGHPAHIDTSATQQRIGTLRAAGEDEAAALLERQLTATKVASELGTMGHVGADPAFQAAYREQRIQGLKPAEAAARAGMSSGFDALGTAADLPEAAVAAAQKKAADMPLDKVPGFLERFVASITSSGLGKPLPAGTVDSTIGAARDQGVEAAMRGVYGPAAALDAIKRAADGTAKPDQQERIEPTFDTGNDIALTPEAEAAHQAATSPLNDLPEPTQAQKDAGNYKVGRLNVAGLDISVENPQGSVRRGTAPDGTPWETPMQDHYGYIRGTVGADKDHLDVFVKPGTPPDFAGPAFVVDQIDPATGKFDEAKVVLGAADRAEAEQVYRRNYGADWQGLGAVTELPMPAFKAWAKSDHTKEPLGDISKAQTDARPTPVPASAPDTADAAVQSEGGGPVLDPGAAQQPDATLTESLGKSGGNGPAGGRSARGRAQDANPFKAFIAKHGIALDERSEFAPGAKEQRSAMVPGYGPIFRRAGTPIDTLVQYAIEDGFLPRDEADGQTKLRAMITDALNGKRISAQYAEGVVEAEAQAEIARRRALEQDAREDIAPLSDEAFGVLSDEEIPWDNLRSNVTVADAMRSLGFTEQEIQDAEAADRPEGARPTGAGAAQPGETAGGKAQADTRAGERPPREEVAPAKPVQTPADAGVSVSEQAKADADHAAALAQHQQAVTALRKRESVLNSLRACLGAA